VNTLSKETIRRLRNQKGVSIAEMAPHVGMSESHLSQTELGTKLPNANALKAIADYLGVTVDSLFEQSEASQAAQQT